MMPPRAEKPKPKMEVLTPDTSVDARVREHLENDEQAKMLERWDTVLGILGFALLALRIGYAAGVKSALAKGNE